MRKFSTGLIRRLVTPIGVGVTAISLVCAAATEFAVTTPRPVVLEVMPVAAIVESPTSIGVADSSLYFAPQTDIDATLDALQSLGVQNVRVQIPWAGVQTWGPNSWDWANADRAINAAHARGMGVLGILAATPFWAGVPYLSGQPNPQAFATYAGVVADRYEGKVSAYEIWNEPNSIQFLNPVDPAGYTALLKAAYPAIKAADPTATVIGGVVGATLTFGALTMNPVGFIEGMYAAGAKGYFDALSYHPYQYSLPFSGGLLQWESPINQLNAIRSMMAAQGDGALKIWATEYGLPTSVVTAADQAAYIKDFLTAWQTFNGAGPVFLYTARDFAVGSTNAEDNFGIFTSNWTPKPAAQVIKDFITALHLPAQQVPAAVFDVVGAFLSQLARIPTEFMNFVANIVQNFVNAIQTLFQGVVQAVTGPLASAAQSVAAPTALRTASATVDAIASAAPARSTGETPADVVSAPVAADPSVATSTADAAVDATVAEEPVVTEPVATTKPVVVEETAAIEKPTTSTPADDPTPTEPAKPSSSLPTAREDEPTKPTTADTDASPKTDASNTAEKEASPDKPKTSSAGGAASDSDGSKSDSGGDSGSD